MGLRAECTELLEYLEDVKIDVTRKHEGLEDVDVFVDLLVVLKTNNNHNNIFIMIIIK